jgi:hypothetical protein
VTHTSRRSKAVCQGLTGLKANPFQNAAVVPWRFGSASRPRVPRLMRLFRWCRRGVCSHKCPTPCQPNGMGGVADLSSLCRIRCYAGASAGCGRTGGCPLLAAAFHPAPIVQLSSADGGAGVAPAVARSVSPPPGGVDTHRDVHGPAAVDTIGGLLARESFEGTTVGYRDLLSWLRSFRRHHRGQRPRHRFRRGRPGPLPAPGPRRGHRGRPAQIGRSAVPEKYLWSRWFCLFRSPPKRKYLVRPNVQPFWL